MGFVREAMRNCGNRQQAIGTYVRHKKAPELLGPGLLHFTNPHEVAAEAGQV